MGGLLLGVVGSIDCSSRNWIGDAERELQKATVTQIKDGRLAKIEAELEDARKAITNDQDKKAEDKSQEVRQAMEKFVSAPVDALPLLEGLPGEEKSVAVKDVLKIAREVRDVIQQCREGRIDNDELSKNMADITERATRLPDWENIKLSNIASKILAGYRDHLVKIGYWLQSILSHVHAMKKANQRIDSEFIRKALKNIADEIDNYFPIVEGVENWVEVWRSVLREVS